MPRLAARFTLPVRHLVWHGPLLGIATDDGKLCLWDREAEGSGDVARSRRRDLAVGSNTGGVRGLAFDPRGELLAAALASGALMVFGLQDGSERHRAQLWPKAVPGAERLLMAWSPDGEALALPGEAAVRLAARGTLAITSLDKGHRLPIVATAWDRLLATASEDAVCLWQPPQLVLTCRPEQQPYGLAWGESHLVVGMASGSWARLNPPSLSAAPAAAEASPSATAGGADAAQPGANSEEAKVDIPEPAGATVEGAAANQVTTAAAAGPGKGAAEPQPVLEPVQQGPFQPGATTREPRRCYLAWNDHGSLRFSVTSSGSGDDRGRRHGGGRSKALGGSQAWSTTGRVLVDYSRECGPTAVRELPAPPHLALGAIGPGVCCLATSAQGRRPARLVVHFAKPWNRDRTSLQHDLPPGETVEALAVSRHFLAALTMPHRFLRVHRLSGVPIAALALSGDPVCLAASDDLLFCVTQAPGPRGAEPCLEYALFGVSAKERLATGTLPLSPASTLRWIGFSTEALPLALDSAGVLRALALSGGQPLLAPGAGEWLPVAELPEGGALLWPVRAEGGALHCVTLPKAGSEPRLGPLYRLEEVRFSLPLGGEEMVVEKVMHTLLAEHVKFAVGAGILPAAPCQVSFKKRKHGGLADEPAVRLRV